MIFPNPAKFLRVAAAAISVLFVFPAGAQSVTGTPTETSVETQRTRVYAAVEKLAPFQIAGCWKNIRMGDSTQLRCKPDQIMIFAGKPDSSAGSRLDIQSLFISDTRLALLNDEQLLAFVAWNHTFAALRHETNADFWGLMTSKNGRGSDFEYSSSVYEKIDWVTLTLLRAVNADLNSYSSMISVVETFDKAAGFSLFSDKKFIARDSGGSPNGDPEKLARLANWTKLLERDSQAPTPTELKFSNILLSRPTWSARTEPLANTLTLNEALEPILGEALGKSVAQSHKATFEALQGPASTNPGHMGKPPVRPDSQMLFAHHPSKRLVWSSRINNAGELCSRSTDCSIIVIGPHLVARPSLAWAQELSAVNGTYKLEDQR